MRRDGHFKEGPWNFSPLEIWDSEATTGFTGTEMTFSEAYGNTDWKSKMYLTVVTSVTEMKGMTFFKAEKH